MLRFRDLGASFSSFGCFVFEIWVLRFRVLGASFSSFGCFVLRSSFSSASFSKLPFTSRTYVLERSQTSALHYSPHAIVLYTHFSRFDWFMPAHNNGTINIDKDCLT